MNTSNTDGFWLTFCQAFYNMRYRKGLSDRRLQSRTPNLGHRTTVLPPFLPVMLFSDRFKWICPILRPTVKGEGKGRRVQHVNVSI